MKLLTYAQAVELMKAGHTIRQASLPKDLLWWENGEGDVEGMAFVAIDGDREDPQPWFPTDAQVKAEDYGIAFFGEAV